MQNIRCKMRNAIPSTRRAGIGAACLLIALSISLTAITCHGAEREPRQGPFAFLFAIRQERDLNQSSRESFGVADKDPSLSHYIDSLDQLPSTGDIELRILRRHDDDFEFDATPLRALMPRLVGLSVEYVGLKPDSYSIIGTCERLDTLYLLGVPNPRFDMMSFIMGLHNLRELCIATNWGMTPDVFTYMQYLPLRSLKTEGFRASRKQIEEVSRIRTLVEVSIDVDYDVTDQDCTLLGKLPALRHLSLDFQSYNHSKSMIGRKGLTNIANILTLESLAIKGYGLIDGDLQSIFEKSHVTSLDLSDNVIALTESGIMALIRLQSARSISLVGNPVTRSGILMVRTMLPRCTIYPAEAPSEHNWSDLHQQ